MSLLLVFEVKQRYLAFFHLELLQISEHIIGPVKHAMAVANVHKDLIQAWIVRAQALVAHTISPDIPLFHPGKVFVQLTIEIFPAAFPHGGSESETQDTADFCPDAIIKDTSQVFLVVIYKGQDRAQPDDCRDPLVTHYLKGFEPFGGSRNSWLKDTTQVLVICG